MYVSAWKETFELAELQGKPVLFSPRYVLPETVPDKWFRYELQRRSGDLSKPRILMKDAGVDFIATLLSPEQIALDHGELNVEGKFKLLYKSMTISDFCKSRHLPEPQDTRKYIPRPASREENEAGVFYRQRAFGRPQRERWEG